MPDIQTALWITGAVLLAYIVGWLILAALNNSRGDGA